MTLETASGTLIPAARNVKPIIESGILKVLPETYINVTLIILNNTNETAEDV